MEISRERFLDETRSYHLTIGLRSRTTEAHSLLSALTPDERDSVSNAIVKALAKAAGAPATRVWHAYLSTSAADGKPAVHAKDRIGTGPWFNAKGVQVAASVADLHSDNNKLSKDNSLNEKGEVNNGRGDNPNRHDILTGSNLDGTATTNTCNNWTSSAADGGAQVGHHDRQGGGQNPTSWNSAHTTPGCGIEQLRRVGGEGFFYCFAAK